MAHPRLMAVRDSLLAAIYERAPNSLILVLGPTGVGKTTLLMKVDQLMTTELLADLRADPGRLPIVSVECIAPESGVFSWRDHFRRLLMRMDEPLLDRKLDPGTSIHIGSRAVRFMPNAKVVGSEYRHAVERALCFRRPIAVMLDEAQHRVRGRSERLAEESTHRGVQTKRQRPNNRRLAGACVACFPVRQDAHRSVGRRSQFVRKCRGTWSAANSTRPEPAGSQAGAFDGQPGGVQGRNSAAAQAAQETGTTSAHARCHRSPRAELCRCRSYLIPGTAGR
jgi:energy-coupling factor transporter ATP-binding protein EcfA2